MKQTTLVVFSILCITLLTSIGYTFYHDSAGKDVNVNVDTMDIPVPFNPDMHTMTISFNDFTYWNVRLNSTVNIVVDEKSFSIKSFESFSLPPTHNFSNIERLNTWQYAHIMVIAVPSKLINTFLNAKNVNLSIQYSNGNHRYISLNDQLGLSKK